MPRQVCTFVVLTSVSFPCYVAFVLDQLTCVASPIEVGGEVQPFGKRVLEAGMELCAGSGGIVMMDVNKGLLRSVAVLLIALGLGIGSAGVASAQESSGAITVGQGNSNTNGQGNNAGESQEVSDNTQVQAQGQGVDQRNSGASTLGDGQEIETLVEVAQTGCDTDDGTATCDNSISNGDTSQTHSGENAVGQVQEQANASGQGNENGIDQGNSAGVSGIGGDDAFSDDDVTTIDGDGNTAGDGAIIGMLIAILLEILAAPSVVPIPV